MTRFMPVRIYEYYAPGEQITVTFQRTCRNNFGHITNKIRPSTKSNHEIERFNETMLNAYNLYALSICHVCGSYQCPYCPIFSNAHQMAIMTMTKMALIVTTCAISALISLQPIIFEQQMTIFRPSSPTKLHRTAI